QDRLARLADRLLEPVARCVEVDAVEMAHEFRVPYMCRCYTALRATAPRRSQPLLAMLQRAASQRRLKSYASHSKPSMPARIEATSVGAAMGNMAGTSSSSARCASRLRSARAAGASAPRASRTAA